MLWSIVVWPANPNYILMPSTFTSIGVLRAGPVLLLQPCPHFREVQKAESFLSKGSIYLLIVLVLAVLVILLENRMYKIPFFSNCVLVSMRSLMQVSHPSFVEPVGHHSSFHWWLDLPDSAVLLLAFLNCRTFLYILVVISWFVLCSKCSGVSGLGHLICYMPLVKKEFCSVLLSGLTI